MPRLLAQTKPNLDTISVYLEHLSDIPERLLAEAVRQHIDTSPWFPRISELRALARKITNVIDFRCVSPDWHLHDYSNSPLDPKDHLSLRALALQETFIHQGIFDESAWLSLIEQLKNTNRPNMAASIRRRFYSCKNQL